MIFEKQRAFRSLTRHPLRPALHASRSAFDWAGTINALCTLQHSSPTCASCQFTRWLPS